MVRSATSVSLHSFRRCFVPAPEAGRSGRLRGWWYRLRAALSVLRRGAGEQVGVDRGVDAGAAAAIGGVAVALVGEEAGRGELAGQGLGPAVRGGRVPGGADHD